MNWKERDRMIVELVAKWRYMTTSQVHYFLFSELKNGYTKAGDRLRSLVSRQKLRRHKVGREYVYYLGDWSGDWQHWNELCNFYIHQMKKLASWEKMTFYPEYIAGNIRADALMIITNTVQNTKRKYFIEIDRGTNKFDKVAVYNNLYKSQSWISQWWADLNAEGKARFPEVIIATVRQESVNQIIEHENKHGLKFTVKKLWEGIA